TGRNGNTTLATASRFHTGTGRPRTGSAETRETEAIAPMDAAWDPTATPAAAAKAPAISEKTAGRALATSAAIVRPAGTRIVSETAAWMPGTATPTGALWAEAPVNEPRP